MKKIVAKGTILGYSIEPVEKYNHQGLYFLRDNELIKLNSTNRQRRGAKLWRGDDDADT